MQAVRFSEIAAGIALVELFMWWLGLPSISLISSVEPHSWRSQLGGCRCTLKHSITVGNAANDRMRRWLIGAHHGAISHKHLDYHLDKSRFWFNRCKSRIRSKRSIVRREQSPSSRLLPTRSFTKARKTRAQSTTHWGMASQTDIQLQRFRLPVASALDVTAIAA